MTLRLGPSAHVDLVRARISASLQEPRTHPGGNLTHPVTRSEDPVWRFERGRARVLFLGRRQTTDRREVLREATGRYLPVSWLRQLHGSAALEASAGCAGDADALVSRQPDLALAISTADCVPVVLASDDTLAVVHAGWRGIEKSIVERTLSRLEADPPTIHAWIGPAIGRCCYEVGDEVARRLAEACGTTRIVEPRGDSNPHVDLVGAVMEQLATAGVAEVETVDVCTRCDARLHSYRRDKDAGRNLTFAWVEGV